MFDYFNTKVKEHSILKFESSDESINIILGDYIFWFWKSLVSGSELIISVFSWNNIKVNVLKITFDSYKR